MFENGFFNTLKSFFTDTPKDFFKTLFGSAADTKAATDAASKVALQKTGEIANMANAANSANSASTATQAAQAAQTTQNSAQSVKEAVAREGLLGKAMDLFTTKLVDQYGNITTQLTDLGQAAKSLGELGGGALSVYGAIHDFNKYKDQKKLLNEQIENMKLERAEKLEDLEYQRNERKRLDGMRSSATASYNS